MENGARYKVAGYIGWLAIAAPTIVDIRSGQLSGARAATWAGAFLLFGAVYALYLRPGITGNHTRAASWLVGIMACAGLTMVLTSVGLMKFLASVTLTIVAAELPYLYRPPVVWLWIAAQSLTLAAIFWLSMGWVSGIAGGSAYAGFQIFALGRTWLEVRVRAARDELARTNAELQATRALLAESSRAAERLRIARDLHDSLGHHLTALSLQLDVASRTLQGEGADHVRQAHTLTRLLLTDVRAVVGELRERGPIDAAGVLRALHNPHDEPRVHVAVPETLVLAESLVNALARSAQEIITNAVRHGRARNVWIAVTRQVAGISLEARDDGVGGDGVRLGHGLRGMRERFEELGGSLELTTAPGRGFNVRGYLPATDHLP